MKNQLLDREIVLQMLRGYEEVNRIDELEKRERLRHLTDAQARQLFDELNGDAVTLNEDEAERLAPLQIEHHLRVQAAMLKLWRLQHHYEPAL
jgi:hypothetical protein